MYVTSNKSITTQDVKTGNITAQYTLQVCF